MVQQPQLLCFTALPNINQLLYTFATIDQQETVKTSHYNLTILKCRQLLFENSNVLACPNLEGLFGIYVVAKECFFRDGTLHEYFKKRNLKPGNPSFPHKYIYEECCYYTITAKLAPKWNMISNYLVSGRDFLTETDTIDAMHLTININEQGDTSFSFKISRIKLPSMTLDKLDLHKMKIKEYESKNVLHLTKFDSKTVRVLPSLKRAKILSISKIIDDKSAITTYQQMKRHWKNTYGYRLPKSDDNMFYVQVKFFEGSPEFTYPSICVRPYEPVFMQRVDPGPVVSVFMADLMKTVPTILGDKYKVPTHLSEPSHELNSLSQKIPHPNASDVGSQHLPKYRQNISATQDSAFAILPTQKCLPTKPTMPDDQRSKLTQLISQLNKPENRTTLYVSQQTPSTPFISETQAAQCNAEMCQKTDGIPKTANSEKTDNVSYSFKQNTEYNQSTNSKNNNSKSFKFIPVFDSPKMTVDFEVNNKNQNTVSKGLKNQLDILNNCVAQRQNTDRNSTSSALILQNIRTEQKFVLKFTSPKNTTNSTDDKNKNSKPILTNLSKSSVQQNINMTENNSGNKSVKRADSPAQINLNQPKFIKNQNKVDVPNLQLKRRLNISEGPSVKKLKDKPMEINNMDEYVAKKTTENLTVPTLVNWLREKSVKCNKKEKKSELIQKVMDFYQHN